MYGVVLMAALATSSSAPDFGFRGCHGCYGGYGYGNGGGSCYWNCRAQGFGPGYCSAYAYNFCY